MARNLKSSKIHLVEENSNINFIMKLDPITYKHSCNVAYYAANFVSNLNYNYSLPYVYYAGLFHDIGKIHIDHKILNKESTLLKREINAIKQHPALGYSMLLNLGLPNEVLEAVKFHHEQFDGNGYPSGIKAEEIPVLARIISICDVFDALTSDRPYREAYSIKEAINIMQNMENHFDPNLFSSFISLFSNQSYSLNCFKGRIVL
jgi:putative nucleotidyltransferase with HDIG domain